MVAFLSVLLGFTCYLCWLAWPSLLPITRGPDLVHHLSLIHFIQDRHALPHDPSFGVYLGEMVSYTPGSHLLAALAGEWLDVDALRVLHSLQAFLVGLKGGVFFCALMRSSRRATVAASLAGTLLLLLPYRYLLEPITVFGFYSQAVAELFAVAILWALVAFHRQPSPAPLGFIGVFASALVLAWPVYFPAVALAVAAVLLFRWWLGARRVTAIVGDLAIALGPAAIVVTMFSVRHAGSAGILRSGGSVIVPGIDVFGWAFLFLAVGGTVLALRRWRRHLPVLAFAVGCTLQIAALAAAQAWLGATNLYLANKTVFLLVYPLAMLAAAVLAFLTRPLRTAAGTPMKMRAVGVLAAPALVFALLAVRNLPVRPLESPISEPVYRAGLWAQMQVPAGCVDYMVEDWVTGYWLHLDVLGNPRASERMRTETFDYRHAIGRWILPGGPTFAIVEDLPGVPADARANMEVLFESPPAAVVRRSDGAGECPDTAPGIREVGRRSRS
ncbi:MAG TPA: hypothetical protein VG106_05810, partial [Vicinamibacterales bacterium]|nr:hypothetical protein [Vicinamibacterales bacterium]